MAARARSREIGPGTHKGGSARALKAGLSDQVAGDKPFLREQMWDVTGNLAYTNPLTLYKDDWVVGWYSGRNSSFWDCKEWLQYYDAGAAFPSVPDLSDGVAATQALARTNPSRPTVDVWNFLWELKDIPQMIFQVGNLMKKYGTNPSRNWPRNAPDITRDVGNAYLAWTFGWEQLGRDIMKLLDFVGDVEKRTEEFDRLSHGSLRRKMTLLEVDIPFTKSNAFYCGPLYQSSVRASLNMVMSRRIWVRIRYKPTAQTFRYLGGDRTELARSIVFGHVPDWSTVWNAIPWSWLLDWFTTAGDFFAANRNRLGVQVDDVAIMRHTSCKLTGVTLVNPQSDSFFRENPHYSWELKSRSRYTGGPVIEAYVPYLQGRHWSILSALAAKYLPR